MLVSENDLNWLNENYPELSYDGVNHLLRGKFSFKMYYSSKVTGYVLQPDQSYDNKDGCLIKDSYLLEIHLGEKEEVPFVNEVGGRIIAAMEKLGVKTLADVHLFRSEVICLTTRPETELLLGRDFSLQDFFDDLLIPRLYYHSFLERYGREPWKGYSHGDLGLLESYYRCVQKYGKMQPYSVISWLKELRSDEIRRMILQNVPVKGHQYCFCNSNLRFRICHKEALAGFHQLQSDYRVLKIGKKFHSLDGPHK